MTIHNISSPNGVSADGRIESTIQGQMLGSMDVLPTPSATYESCTVLYIGSTTEDYTQDRFYRCMSTENGYAWVELQVSEGGGGDLSNYVTKDTTVAGHPLSSDVVITPSDIGAVPTSRTINSKALSLDVTLDAGDVGAIASSYLSTAKPTSTSTDTEVPTSKAVYTAVDEVADAVSSEATTRSNADSSLQSQIDALIAKSDVVDIVGTKTELDNYDTSVLGNNDIVKVLSDSSHSDMTTYYRWVITAGTGAWEYIGGEGPYLTTSSASSTYVPKTTTINSKALSGNISLDAGDVGAIPSSYLVTSAPASGSTDAQVPSAKAVYSALTNGTVTKVGTGTVGSATRPVYLNAGVPTQGTYTLGDACNKGVDNVTTAGALAGLASWVASTNLVTRNTIAYWDGRYASSSATASNFAYCKKGAFGDACVKGVATSVASGNTNLVTSGAVYTYVTNIFNGSY